MRTPSVAAEEAADHRHQGDVAEAQRLAAQQPTAHAADEPRQSRADDEAGGAPRQSMQMAVVLEPLWKIRTGQARLLITPIDPQMDELGMADDGRAGKPEEHPDECD